MSQHPLEDIFHPKSVAIAGASEMGDGGRYLSALLKLGFKGKIYPVHPKYQEVFGVKCYAERRYRLCNFHNSGDTGIESNR